MRRYIPLLRFRWSLAAGGGESCSRGQVLEPSVHLMPLGCDVRAVCALDATALLYCSGPWWHHLLQMMTALVTRAARSLWHQPHHHSKAASATTFRTCSNHHSSAGGRTLLLLQACVCMSSGTWITSSLGIGDKQTTLSSESTCLGGGGGEGCV